ncbi:hypothetical protein [Tuberibacillus calidus]|uniref:hypothetical protein n=1 Tax=Tuberibacillus calidus TaxID=340097 RepID=UPI0012DE7792|nr:hypothetical protein [Tuberibacillus calidus]
MDESGGVYLNSTFKTLPAKFLWDRIFVYPVTESGYKIEFYTDTGGGGMFLSPDVSNDLGLPANKKVMEDGEEKTVVPFPTFQEGLSIPSGAQVRDLIVYSEIPWGKGFLGQSWFADRVWLLDYINKEMGYLSNTSSYHTNGFKCTNIWFKENQTGKREVSFPRIQAKIDGETLDFLFDTGATVYLTDHALETLNNGDEVFRGTSFITRSIFEKWRVKHPEWTVIEQADRIGNEALIKVPMVEVAGLQVGPVWFTRRNDANFHEAMSQWMDKKVEGALGGSVFKYFTIIIDYPNAKAFFKC